MRAPRTVLWSQAASSVWTSRGEKGWGDALLEAVHGDALHGADVQLALIDQPVEPGADAAGVDMLGGVLEAAMLQAHQVGADVMGRDVGHVVDALPGQVLGKAAQV